MDAPPGTERRARDADDGRRGIQADKCFGVDPGGQGDAWRRQGVITSTVVV